MKYRVVCKSILLQKALEEFLKNYLDEEGDIISDYEGDIIIGKDIKKPFSKSSLLIQLQHLQNKKFIKGSNQPPTSQSKLSFEQKLDILIDEFSEKLKKLIKEEYAKK